VTQMPRAFPAIKPDGTFTVASRFVGPAEALVDVQAEVTKSVQRIEGGGAAFDSEFGSSPRVERDGDTILVIFEGKSDAKLWKDWLVAVTQDVERALDNVRFSEFYDLVAGRPATP
jgi:hypothetical protein